MSERPYPRHVHRCGGVFLEVTSDEAYDQAMADGWLDRPDPSWPVPFEYRAWTPDLDLSETPVSAPAIVPVEPRRPGRPRKTPTASKDAA